jgi:histidinol-phosphate aminotransferase
VRVGDGQQVFGEMQKCGVIVRPMAAYHIGEWIRITVGTAEQNERCLKALRKVLGR